MRCRHLGLVQKQGVKSCGSYAVLTFGLSWVGSDWLGLAWLGLGRVEPGQVGLDLRRVRLDGYGRWVMCHDRV